MGQVGRLDAPIGGRSLTTVQRRALQKPAVPSGLSAVRMLIGPVKLTRQVFQLGCKFEVPATKTPVRSLMMVLKLAAEERIQA